jgi:hypothetical protein
MNNDDIESYKVERYFSEIKYYEDRAKSNKIYYHVFQWIVIVLSASVPVLASLLETESKIITVIVSIVLAIGTTALKTFKFQENWLNFRAVAEMLKKELFYYNANIEGYEENENKNRIFVERVESLISREHSLWIGRNKPSAIEKKGE